MQASRSHFETLVDSALESTLSSHSKVALGDSHRHAFLQGRVNGLTEACQLYRRAARTDLGEAA